MKLKLFAAPVALLATSACVIDNSYDAPPSAAPMVEAPEPTVSAEDRASLAEAITNLYAVISGPIGQERDWEAMKAMMTDDVRFYSSDPNGRMSGGGIDHYIRTSGPFLKDTGFTERELNHRMEVFGGVAHVWSSYEASFSQNGQPLKLRGINSIQLHRQADGGWKIHSIFWQHSFPGLPLPADMDDR